MALSDPDVARIRAMRIAGVKIMAIGFEYGISERTVSRICMREDHAHVPWWEEWMIYSDGRAFP